MHKMARNEVARFMRRLYRQGLTTTSGGNLSVRVSDTHVLLTGSKSDKGLLRGSQVGVLISKGPQPANNPGAWPTPSTPPGRKP